MIQIKTAMRLSQFNSQNLVNAISNLDNFIVDSCPLVDQYKKDYYKKYEGQREKMKKRNTKLYYMDCEAEAIITRVYYEFRNGLEPSISR